jgi:hypothetical protein
MARDRILVLVAILWLALVFSELDPETLLRVCNSLQGSQRNLELSVAESADSDCGGRAEPLDDSKVTFFHLPSQNSCACTGEVSSSTGFAQSASSFCTWLTLVLTGYRLIIVGSKGFSISETELMSRESGI